MGLSDERAAEQRSHEAPTLSPLEACMQSSLVAGEFARVQESELREEDDDAEAWWSTKKKSPWSAEVGGFNVHAGVMIHAADRAGLEQLCRSAARAPVALERLSMLEDGRVADRLRKAWKNGAMHVAMTNLELLAKMAWLIPPPKRPLLRLSGVLDPGPSCRASVVPRKPKAQPAHACGTAAKAVGKDRTELRVHAGGAVAKTAGDDRTGRSCPRTGAAARAQGWGPASCARRGPASTGPPSSSESSSRMSSHALAEAGDAS